jgi:hypothetical protein
MFAAEIRRRRVSRMRGFRQRKWHLDDIYVKIIGEMHYLWRAVDREGEILEGYVTRTRDKAGARETASRARYFSHRTAAFIAFVTSIRKMRLIEGLPQPNNFSCWQCDPFVIAAGRNATSSIVRLTRPAAQPHWLSGSRLWPDRRWGGGALRQGETSCGEADSTTQTPAYLGSYCLVVDARRARLACAMACCRSV